MKRRSFLKSVGAAVAAPLVPIPLAAFGSHATVVPKGTYMWAETIVRAHSNCNLAMLQRHLRLDINAAGALQSQLIKNGVISAQANAYGLHKAVKPLFDGAFLKPSNPIPKIQNVLEDVVDGMRQSEAESKNTDGSDALCIDEEVPDVAKAQTDGEQPLEVETVALELSSDAESIQPLEK